MGEVELRITCRLKEIKKRRALRGKQKVELLINSAGKRTVVLLNPSFFYFSLHRLAAKPARLCPSLLRYRSCLAASELPIDCKKLTVFNDK